MKSLASILILVLFPFFASSQERVTEIKSKGTSNRQLLSEVDGEKFIIAYTHFDSILVYKIEGEEAIFLHSSYYPCVYSNELFFEADGYLFLTNIDRTSIYNYRENSFYEVPIDEERIVNSWRAAHDGQVLLRKQNAKFQSVYYLVDYKSDSFREIPIDEDIRDQFGDFVSYGFDEIYSYNIETNEKRLVAENVKEFCFIGSKLYFINDIGLYEADVRFNQQSQIQFFIFPFEYPKLVVGKDNYFVYEKNWERVSIIERGTNISTNLIPPKEVDFIHPEIINNQFIFISDNELIILELDSHSYSTINVSPNSTFNDIHFLNNEYLYYGSILYSLNGDISLDLDIDLPYTPATQKSSFQIGNKFYISSDFYYNEKSDLYNIDISNFTGGISNVIPRNEIGMELNTRKDLLEIENDIILVYEDLYQITNGIAVQINSEPLWNAGRAKYYIESHDCISWVEKEAEGFGIYTFKNGEVMRNVLIPFLLEENLADSLSISNYLVVGDKTYFTARQFEEKLWSYDRLTNIFEEVVKFDYYQGYFDLNKSGNTFYFSYDILQMIDEDGNIKQVNSDVESDLNLFAGNFINFNNKLFYKSRGTYYQVEEDKLTPLLSSLAHFSIHSEIEGKLHIRNVFTNHEEYFIFDGNSLYPIVTDKSQRLTYLSNDYFAVVDVDANSKSILNSKTMVFYDLPENISNKEIHNISILENDLILYTSESLKAKQLISVYKTNNLFNIFEKKIDFPIELITVDLEVNSILSDQLHYFHDKLLSIDNDGNFQIFKNLKGVKQSVGITTDKNHYYFIAIDPTYGRQVFRLPIDFDGILDSTNDLQHVQNIEVYPNPTYDKLTINSNLVHGGFKYQIFNTLGSQVGDGNSVNAEIDAGQLMPGTYFLIVQDKDGGVFVSKFVKVD